MKTKRNDRGKRQARGIETIAPDDSAIVFHPDGTFEVSIPIQEDDAPVYQHSLLVTAIAGLIGEGDDRFFDPVRARMEEITALGKNLAIH